jgi:GNAT superfamily N-acetyltransferase
MEQAFKEFKLRPARQADGPAIRELVFDVLREYGLAPDENSTDADLTDVEAAYTQRGGFFGVVENKEGVVSGTYGLYPLPNGVAEIRKMYLRPALRGRGLGSFLLDSLLKLAKEKTYTRVELETAGVLKEAIGLYTKKGFKPVQREEMSCRCDQVFALSL